MAAIRCYDLIAVQEIQNKTGEAARNLLAAVNAEAGPEYAMLLSDSTGLQDDDLSSQERYAYFFGKDRVRALNEGVVYDDRASDLFQREPFVARFDVDGWDFSLVEVHTQPKAGVAEIGALHEVITWVRSAYQDDDVIAVGDFNASCDYASSSELDALALRGDGYAWIVGDDADTNVASRACAYDRIVTTVACAGHFTGVWGVDMAPGDVSDHYPVWAEFRSVDL